MTLIVKLITRRQHIYTYVNWTLIISIHDYIWWSHDVIQLDCMWKVQWPSPKYSPNTVEGRYNAVQFSTILHTLLQLLMQIKIRVWTHKIHPIPRHNGRAMGCNLWGFGKNWPRYKGTPLHFLCKTIYVDFQRLMLQIMSRWYLQRPDRIVVP